MDPNYWLGEKAYNAFSQGRYMPFNELPPAEQMTWIMVASVVTSNAPAPIALEIYARFPNRPSASVPIMKNLYATDTKESIAEACEALRVWLEEIGLP